MDHNWHVFFGILSYEFIQSWCGANRSRGIVTIFHEGGSSIITTEHFDSLCSAQYYVHWKEHGKILDDISADVAKRGLWKERLTELREILERFNPGVA